LRSVVVKGRRQNRIENDYFDLSIRRRSDTECTTSAKQERGVIRRRSKQATAHAYQRRETNI